MPQPLLFKQGRIERPDVRPQPVDGREASHRHIRCPQCGWPPPAGELWRCRGPEPSQPAFAGCGTVWDTFATRGVCPGCAHRWQWTHCPRCDEWSRHEDWYEDEG